VGSLAGNAVGARAGAQQQSGVSQRLFGFEYLQDRGRPGIRAGEMHTTQAVMADAGGAQRAPGLHMRGMQVDQHGTGGQGRIKHGGCGE